MRIFIVMSHTNTIFTNMIKSYTKTPYNHVSIALDENLEKLYSFGRHRYWNVISSGFVNEHITGVLGHYKTKCKIFELEISQEEYNNIRKRLLFFINNRRIYRFSLFRFYNVIVQKPFKLKKRFFCSNFVAFILYKSGIKIIDKDPSIVSPTDFYNSNLHVVYEGYLRDYLKT